MSEVPETPQSHDDALSPPTFSVLPLSSETRASLAKMGYTNPTPVQRAVFEPASRGKDLVVQARTGTGKTAAFGLPIVEHLVRRSQAEVQTLCLCPTRELALQVAGELERLGEGRQIKPVAVYGGAPMGRQVEALRSGAQVVVGTPGRVLDHIRRGTLQTSTIRALVLDEADEMLSMGFERELSAILDALPKDRQTLLFSATVPPDIERMARDRLRQPEFITLSSDAVGALSISHFVYFVLEDKLGALLRILETENPESAIIFCNTKAETEVVSAALTNAGFDSDWLNGDLPQNDREEVVSRIRNGTLRFLVATDVAARGIDISHLTHVLNYDFPDNTENYVHRTGRTGRAGRTGTAISLVHPQDIGNLYFLRLAYKIKPFERSLPTSGELRTRHEIDLLNSLSESFAGKDTDAGDLLLARRLLSHDRAEVLLAHLLRNHFGDRISAELGAAASRRAKNPSPPPAPTLVESTPTPRAEAPREYRGRDRGRDDRGRDDRGRDDRGRDRGRDDRGRDDRGRDRGQFRDRDDRGRDRFDRDRDRPSQDRDRPSQDRDRSPQDRDRPSQEGDRSRFRGRDDRPSQHRRSEPAVVSPAAVEVELPEQPVAEPVVESAPPPVVLAPEEAPELPTEPLPEVESAPEAYDASAQERPRYEKRRGQNREPSRERAPSPNERKPRRSRGAAPEEEFEFRYTVSDAEPGASSEPAPAVPAPAPVHTPTPAPAPTRAHGRPSDLANWHPPEEDNDDLPIWGGGQRAGAEPEETGEAPDDQDFALVFVDVGRREGVRPSDLQRALRDRAGIGRRETGRIRVRDRHSLVAVRRDLLARAIDGLTGAEIAGRVVRAEQAREREAEND